MVKFQRIREMLVETVTGAHPVVHVNAAGTVVGNTVDTELAAAVAAADNLANPTAPQVLAHMVGTVSGGTTAARARLNGNFIQGAAILSGNGVTDGSAAEFGSEQGAGAGIASLGVANMVYNGATWDMQRVNSQIVNVAAVAITAATPVTIKTPTAGKKWRVLGFSLSTTVAGSIIFKDSGTERFRTPLLLANTPYSPPPLLNGLLSTTINNTLQLDLTATGNVSGFVLYCEE